MNHSIQTLADLLCQSGHLDHETVILAEKYAQQHHIPFISSVVRNKWLSGETILAACIKQFKLPCADLRDYDVSLLQDGPLNHALIDEHHVLPLKRDQHSLQIALSDPTNQTTLTTLRFHTGLRIHPVLAREETLDSIIQTHCRPNILYAQLKSALSRIEATQTHDNQLQDEPVIQFVRELLQDAANKSISDIHIENFTSDCRIRFRHDGLLQVMATLPLPIASRIITRLKIMANLDIAEQRLPQDGRFSYRYHHTLDVRVSTCPALHGENMVLRLLNHDNKQLSLAALGLSPQQLIRFEQAIQRPQGLILVTGPTGSGKTTTLYAALQQLNQPDKNILTIEDPVEIEVPGLTQVNVNTKINLNFATALRALLRQDPDIMMVGEIRDTETATMAIQAAQTGHLVLSTLHTNNAVDAIKRLLALGISPCQLAGSLTLLVAQRLVRKQCLRCSLKGCADCRQGYLGRTGIFEVLPISSLITQLLLAKASLADIEYQFLHEAHPRLADSGLAAWQAGITSSAEIARVMGDYHA